MKKTIRLKIAEEAPRQATVAPTVENYDESLDHRKKSAEGTINIISFFLGADEYAFEVSEAVEVLRPRQATEVPWTPAYIQGILSVRGEMVPVLDLKMRLGLGKVNGRPTARILVVAVEDLKAGLLVDRLSGVKEVPARLLEPPEDSEPQAAFMKAVIHDGERVIRLLDAGVLIAVEN
ncbi:MAG: chemotaxis protein CheW [Thermodesulfobacteriota bacterium]|nr:MAG: chemotaxis protein CheW [Thermodesulfobacteriota bacterium]